MRIVETICEEDFNILIRKNRIFLSAPHAVKQVREGRVKACETRTKYIVDKVAKRTNSCCIFKTKCLNDDANYDNYSYYRKKCSDIVKEKDIKVLIDVHGMSATRKEDICIGTAYGKNINNRKDVLENVVKIFNNNSFSNVSIDIPFAAKGKNCVSSYIHDNCEIITFQIELNYRYLCSKYPEYDLNKIINTLTDIVEYLKICIE